MKESVLLKAAKAYIEKGWTQKTCARDAQGNTVNIDQEERDNATCWCAFGALVAADFELSGKSYGPSRYYKAERLLDRFVNQKGLDYGYITFNDTFTQADVIEMFDWAIAEAEKQEAVQ